MRRKHPWATDKIKRNIAYLRAAIITAPSEEQRRCLYRKLSKLKAEQRRLAKADSGHGTTKPKR